MAINNITIPIVGTPFPEPKSEKPETSEEVKLEEAKPSRNLKKIEAPDLFNIAQTLASANDSGMYHKDRYYIEYREDSERTSVYIYVNIDNSPNSDLVFSATNSKSLSQGQRKIKVMVYRPGKWVEYLVDTLYPQVVTLRITEVNDDEIDYSQPWLNDVLPQGFV